MSFKPLFQEFAAGARRQGALGDGLLHFCAHSHHWWPDVAMEAHRRAWDDAARFADEKWDVVFGEVMPAAQRHLARVLGLSRPGDLATAVNTHEFVVRLFSCFAADHPVRVLTTSSEFHSFRRQIRRLEEQGAVSVERVATEPFESFPQRFAAAAAAEVFDLIYVSQVFFDSGSVYADLPGLVAACGSDETFITVDGYHGFNALPTDLSALESRIFYTGGGYKYAMSGEGACFLHCPPGYGPRPVNSGWFAEFGVLESPPDGSVPYGTDGTRFGGATFDPSAWYRFNAVQDLLVQQGLTVGRIHAHVRQLQTAFLEALGDGIGPVVPAALIPGRDAPERGHFLTFRLDRAGEVQARLRAADILTDFRNDRLRFGFGLYHDPSDVDELIKRMKRIV